MIYINPVKFNCINKINSSPTSFCSRKKIEFDTFKKEPVYKTFEMNVYNPYTNSNFSNIVSLNFQKPQTIILDKTTKKSAAGKFLVLNYDPERIDYLWDKKNNKPLQVNILTSENKDSVAYHFMSKNLKKEFGYVQLTDLFDKIDSRLSLIPDLLFRDHKDIGIVGPRVIVDYLQNWDDEAVGGVGFLADKLAVKHCLDNNIEPNIVSEADWGSHVAHYLRGKRFFPLERWSPEYEFFMSKYNTSDVNNLLQDLINEAKISGENVDLKDWGLLPMYMPKKLAAQIAKTLLSKC